jgi:hypothetical protein
LYPRWERGYRRHAHYIDEITAVAGVGIAPPPQIGTRTSDFNAYSWYLYSGHSAIPGGESKTLRAAKKAAENAYQNRRSANQ